MARASDRLPQNAPGDFFVDATCIDCDTCRQIAPATFRDHGGQSSVQRQPAGEAETLRALMALVACPTASIGTSAGYNVRAARRAFPERLDANVHFCGYTSEASFGGWSYLIVHPRARGGNVLVDSPRFAEPLVEAIAALGGVSTMFLTHRDDVADHARFAVRFGCRRVMHAADGAARLGIERIIDGVEAVPLDHDLVAIPTPGHTRGHMVLLYEDRYLFTGDHLAGSPGTGSLTAYEDVAWYSWPEQIRSIGRLLDHRFEWVLPGHGPIHRAPAATIRSQLEELLLRLSAGID